MSPIKFLTPKTIRLRAGRYSHTATATINDVEPIFVSSESFSDNKGNLLGKDGMLPQTQQTLKTVQSAQQADRASFEDVSKSSAYVTHMDRSPEVSDARNAFLPKPKSISSVLKLGKLVLCGTMIQIEPVAPQKILE